MIYNLPGPIGDLSQAILTIGFAALVMAITVSAIRATRWFYLRHAVAG